MKNILLIRHGQSEWNKLNLFTGFKNIELSEQGIEEANKAGQNFKNLDIKFNIVFTSELKRAQETAKIILQNLDQWDFLNNEGKIISNINLNERDYGDLTGLNKKKLLKNLEKNKFINGEEVILINPLTVKVLRMWSEELQNILRK